MFRSRSGRNLLMQVSSVHGRMTSSKSQLPVIRRATIDDFEGILSIGTDLYQGLDYLPATLIRLLSDPKYLPLAYELNGQVIGHSGAHIIDNGKTAIPRGGRLHPKAQGQKLFTDFKYQMSFAFKEAEPRLETCLSTFKNSDPVLKTSSFWKAWKKMLTRDCIAYKFPKGGPSIIPDPPDHVKTIDQEAMGKLLENDTLHKDLFPMGYVFSRFLYFKAAKENLHALYHLRPTVLGSFESRASSPAFLTIGLHYPCWAGYAYHIECFGEDISQLLPHIWFHMKQAKSLTANDIYMHILCDEGMRYQHLLDKDVERSGGHPHVLPYTGYVACAAKMVDLLKASSNL